MGLNKKKLQDIFGTGDVEQPTIDMEEVIDEEVERQVEEYADNLPVQAEAKEVTVEDRNSDLQNARVFVQNMMEKSKELIEIALENADGGNARDVEVAAKSLEAALSSSEKLIEIHEKLARIRQAEKTANPENLTQINQTNNTINVTTANLLEKIANGEL